LIHSNRSNIMSSFVRITYDISPVVQLIQTLYSFRGVKILTPIFTKHSTFSNYIRGNDQNLSLLYFCWSSKIFATRWFQLSVYWWFLGYIFVLKRFIVLFDILMQLKSLHRHLTNFLFYRYKTINFNSPKLFKYLPETQD